MTVGDTFAWDESRQRAFEEARCLYDQDREREALVVIDRLLVIQPGVEEGVRRLTEIRGSQKALELVKLRCKCFSALCAFFDAPEDKDLCRRALENAEICRAVLPFDPVVVALVAQVYATVGLTETALDLAQQAVALEGPHGESIMRKWSLAVVRQAVAQRRDEAGEKTRQALEILRRVQDCRRETPGPGSDATANGAGNRREEVPEEIGPGASPDGLSEVALASALLAEALAVTELDVESWAGRALLSTIEGDEEGAVAAIRKMETIAPHHPALEEVREALNRPVVP